MCIRDRDAGFDDGFSGAVTAASSTIGPIIPPSISMVLYGGLTSVSVGRLFLGGFLPGILMGLSLMVIVYIVAKKRDYPVSHKASRKEKWIAFLDALPSLLMPVIILGGILSGFFTPTEAATIACFYALFLGVFIYKEINLRNFWTLMLEAMRNTSQVMAIIAAAGLFGWLLTYNGVPAAIISGLVKMCIRDRHMAYYNDKLNVTMWPYMFESYEHAAKAYDSEVGEYMKKMAEDAGFKVIDWMYYGFRNLSANKPINKVDDIKGCLSLIHI